jgi:hypothetical protein
VAVAQFDGTPCALEGDTVAIARQAAVVSNGDTQAGAAYLALRDLALCMAQTSKAAAANAAGTR